MAGIPATWPQSGLGRRWQPALRLEWRRGPLRRQPTSLVRALLRRIWRLPVRQPVPGCIRTLEHEWKDGSPWPSGEYTGFRHPAARTDSTSHLRDTASTAARETIDAVRSGTVLAEVRPDTLTAIMEGKAKRVGVGQAERGTEVDHNLRSAILSLTC